MCLFVKVDPIAAGLSEPKQIKEFMKLISLKCIQYGYDGIILDN